MIEYYEILFYNNGMIEESLAVLKNLADLSYFEQEEPAASSCVLAEDDPPAAQPTPSRASTGSIPEIFHAKKSGGGEIRLLKTVLSTACERNCNYCAFRAGRDFHRETLKPDAMAKLFTQLNQAGIAEGLFLSSGVIGGGIRTQDKIIDTAEILRLKLGYKGYLHLKIMPGAEKDQVLRAMQLANRVSINLEAPNPSRLLKLAPLKTFADELLKPLRWADEIRRTINPLSAFNLRWPSLATQFVVGSVDESDRELLQITQYLHGKLSLSRIYFSRFEPVLNTPFENLPPENPMRQVRLYQAAFLLRDYGYTLEDFQYSDSGRLPLDADPKLAWAREHLAEHPLEINTADRIQLLRIPGIGPVSVKRILKSRNRNPIKELGALRALGISLERALPFILMDGKRPDRQLRLW